MKTKKTLLLRSAMLLLCSSAVGAMAQSVVVKDRETGAPISKATLYTGTAKVVSNAKGAANISALMSSDTIRVMARGYNLAALSSASLAKGGDIFLSAKSYDLDELVVSATRWEESQKDVPNQITKVTPRDIELRNPQTTGDAVAQTGQVYVQKSQMGGGSPMIRGFAANAILLAFDGVRMNNAIYRGGNLQNIITVDANSLSSIEILYGPGSVMYGSDALGGVINMRSKELIYTPSEHSPLVFGDAMVRTNTANNEATGSVSLSAGWESFSLHTSITASDFGPLRMGASVPDGIDTFGLRTFYVERINGADSMVTNSDPLIQRGTEYRQINILQKLGWKVSSDVELQYSFLFTTSSDVPRSDRLFELRPNGLPRSAEWYYGPQRWMVNALKARLTAPSLLWDKLDVTLAWQDYKESRNDRSFGNANLRSQREHVGMGTLNIDAKKEFGEQTELYWGAEFVTNTATSEADRTNINTGAVTLTATRYPDGDNSTFSAAAYAQLVHRLSERASFVAGLRGTYTTLKSSMDSNWYALPVTTFDLSNGAITGTLGGVYSLTNSVRVNANVATGFRAPNIDDVAKVFDSAPGEVVVPNPNLKPEYTIGAELGLSWTSEDGSTVGFTWATNFLTDAIERRAALFNGQDSIDYNGTRSRVTMNQNVGKGYTHTASLYARWNIASNWSLSGSGTWTEGRDTQNDVPLRHVPPAFGRLGLNWQEDIFSAELFSDFHAWRHIWDLSPDGLSTVGTIAPPQGYAAWWTLNLRGTARVLNWATLTVSLDNIFDRQYRAFSSGINAPGRAVTASLRVRF